MLCTACSTASCLTVSRLLCSCASPMMAKPLPALYTPLLHKSARDNLHCVYRDLTVSGMATFIRCQTCHAALQHSASSFPIAPKHAPAGNPCEEHAPQSMDTISACLRRNRLGLGNDPLRTPVKGMGEVGTPPTMYHTVQPFGTSSSPDCKDGGSARRVLQTIDKENWALSTGMFVTRICVLRLDLLLWGSF